MYSLVVVVAENTVGFLGKRSDGLSRVDRLAIISKVLGIQEFTGTKRNWRRSIEPLNVLFMLFIYIYIYIYSVFTIIKFR